MDRRAEDRRHVELGARELRVEHAAVGATIEMRVERDVCLAAEIALPRVLRGALHGRDLSRVLRSAPVKFADDVVRAGRARWPRVVVTPVAFAAHCERLGITETQHGEDLYLACACAAGDAAAIACFDDELAPIMRAAVRRIDRLIRENGRHVVVDYKSGQPDSERLERDRLQVRQYSAAISSMTGTECSALLWYVDLESDRVVEV